MGSNCLKWVKNSVFLPNGCGPKGGVISTLAASLIPELAFGDACKCHDYAYFWGGCKSVDPNARTKADAEFAAEMEVRIEGLYFWRRPFLRQMARLYHWAVAKYGDKSFNWFDTPEKHMLHLIECGVPNMTAKSAAGIE